MLYAELNSLSNFSFLIAASHPEELIQAAVLNVKLPYLNHWIEQRKVVADRYLDRLQNLPGLELPNISIQEGMVHGWNQFVVIIKYSMKLFLMKQVQIQILELYQAPQLYLLFLEVMD